MTETTVVELGINQVELTSGDIKMFAELVYPQPPNLPEGLVLIKLPYNCYVDLNKEPCLK